MADGVEAARRRKISESLKKLYASGTRKKLHPWAGKKHTEETKRVMSEKKALWWKTHDTTKTREKIGESSKGRAARMGWIGDKHPAWRGGRFIQKRGGYVYVYAPNHPHAKRNSKGGGGYVLEHRLIVEKSIGRYLTPDEDVNHINGKKDDNRIENLAVVLHHAHYEQMCCPKCGYEFRTR